MKELTIRELYTLDETIAKDLFEGLTYPWEALPKIKDFILKLGETLPEEEKILASGKKLSPEVLCDKRACITVPPAERPLELAETERRNSKEFSCPKDKIAP